MNQPVTSPRRRWDRAVAEARRLKFTVHCIDYCEDARTPGLLGGILGVTSVEEGWIKIRRCGRNRLEQTIALEHELEHAAGRCAADRPEIGLVCGSRRPNEPVNR